jgi:hypothetical protein
VTILLAIRDCLEVKGAERAVLEAILLRADRKKQWGCFPSLPVIAADARLSVRSAQRSILTLEKAGLISITHRPYTSNFYHVNVKTILEAAAAKKAERGTFPACPFDDGDDSDDAVLNELTDGPQSDVESEEEDEELDPEDRASTPPARAQAPTQKPYQRRDRDDIAAALVQYDLDPADSESIATALIKGNDRDVIESAMDALDRNAVADGMGKATNPAGYLRACIERKIENYWRDKEADECLEAS